jgi:hypothetical protein
MFIGPYMPVGCILWYLKTLKGYVQNRARDEARMAEGYVIDEAFGFCTDYMQTYTITSRKVCDDKDDPTMNDENTQRCWATKDTNTQDTRLVT